MDCYILEEHNEAFIAWMAAAKCNLIQKKNNILLHFDDHSDMGSPRFNKPISNILNENLQYIVDIAYSELAISSFIVPAIYLGLFKELFWVRCDVQRCLEENMFVRSYNCEGKFLMKGRMASSSNFSLLDKDLRKFKYSKVSEEALSEKHLQGDILLDIDLDYFSSVDNPYIQNEVVIEITSDEYEEFVSNPYHYLRFLVNKVEAVKRGTSYFYIINYYNQLYPSARKVSLSEIDSRVKNFIHTLEVANIQPRLITICRSRYSGFTPVDQWEYIEAKLLTGLSSLYIIDLKLMDGLVSKHSQI